jgi:hypothetical protein
MSKTKPRKSPIKDLVRALNKDEGYRETWHANLSMAFRDNYRWYMRKKRRPSHADLRAIGNLAANYFLGILTGKLQIKRAKPTKATP